MISLPESSRIAIIGGGVMGLFTAWELASRGERDIIILERRSFLGAGATQKAAGGVRAQFTTAPNVMLSKYSQDFYRRRFAQEINPYFEYHRNGYLFFARNEEKLRALNKSLELQKQQGVDAVRRLSPDEILDLMPGLYIGDILGGNYSPEDGFVDPGDIVYGLETRLREDGIRIFTDTEVTGVETLGDLRHRVETKEGSLVAEKILFAVGAWSGELMKKCGVDVPIEPFRRNLYITDLLPWFPKTAPFTFDVVTGSHFKPESGGIVMLKINPDEPSSFNEEVDWDWLEQIIPDFIHVMPRLAEARIKDGWAGLYDMSPDHSAILGPVPGHKGWFIATGFSGHGLMHSPAVGCAMSEYILDGVTSTIDVSAFRLDRYRTGELIRELAVF